MAEEVSTPGGKLVKITGVKKPGKTVSILGIFQFFLVSVLSCFFFTQSTIMEII